MQETQAGGAERRRHPRYDVNLPVQIYVLMEELTFSPFQFEGTFLNISEGGALVVVRGMSRDGYNRMLQRPRYVRIGCQFPGSDKAVRLFGKLVWYDFRQDSDGTVCRMALTFEAMPGEIAAEMTRYIDTLSAPGGSGDSGAGSAAKEMRTAE